MSEINELEKVEIRSEEVQEILGTIPHWIVRRGIGVMGLVIVAFFFGSWLFQYPEIVSTSLTITTENPPAFLVAYTNGKMKYLLVKDNQLVNAGDTIAIIDNPASYLDVATLKTQLKKVEMFVNTFAPKFYVELSEQYALGEIQTVYSNFFKTYISYQDFEQQESYHQQSILSLKYQIEQHGFLLEGLRKQRDLLKEDLDLKIKEFGRDSILYHKNLQSISIGEYEQSRSSLLQKKYSFKNMESSLYNADIQIAQLKQSVLDAQMKRTSERLLLQNTLKESYKNLKSSIATWEQRYVLSSPVYGKVTFTHYWSVNQNIMAGDTIFTVVPKGNSRVIGKINLPISGSGKVEKGQQVNVKLSAFPYMEHGILKGKIQSISLVPTRNCYSVEVFFPDSLKTAVGKFVKFKQGMTGTADIITKDARLLERYIQPITALFKEHVKK